MIRQIVAEVHAAKNKTGPAGIAYKVVVRNDVILTAPIRVTARIYYKLTDDLGGATM